MIVLASLVLASSLTLPQGAPDYEKMRVLSESVLGKRPATEGEIQALLAAAVTDPDPRIRREAVGILATIRFMSSMPQTPPGQEWAVRLESVADALWPEVENAADDPDAAVRREALRGIVGGALYAKPGSALPVAILRKLATHFDKYSDVPGRSLIIGALQSSYGHSDPEGRALALGLLTKALREQEPYLVQAAGLSATKAAAPEILPLLVAQLKNPSHVARMGVAQGIASYRAAARPYVPQLEAALAAETDDITRKTIAGTISVINR